MTPTQALEHLGRPCHGRPVLLRNGPLAVSWRVQLPGEGTAVLRVDHRAHASGPQGGNQLTVPGFRANALGLDRALEYRLLGQLAPAGLAPAPLAADPARGLLLRAWVPGHTWDDGPVPGIDQAAAALARVHAFALAPGEIAIRDWPATIARYAALAGPAGATATAQARAALALLPPTDPAAAVLCHHDPLAANVLGTGLFLDWEYALAGNPLFDLAVLGLGLGLSRPGQWSRLAAAWGAHRPGGPAATRHLPAWVRFARAVAPLWDAVIAGLP